MKKYSLVIVTNVPSFYKINLYNRINEYRSILCFFTNDTAELRQQDFFKGEMKFDHVILKSTSARGRILEFRKSMKKISYDELMICGLNEPIHWYCAFRYPKKKNSTIIESSSFESKTDGIKGFIKKIYFKRISKSYVSGKSQERLARLLEFKGKIITTGGVGIFNIQPTPKYTPKSEVKNFLYVGRLAPVKNLELLIKVFKSFPSLNLNIVGYGPLESELKSISSENIHFLGAIENGKLPEIYQSNDVFILPSKKEPWGLVVEEALNNGLPIILSNRVGCWESLLNEGENGFKFDFDSEQQLVEVINRICDIETYNRLRKNVCNINFEEYARRQTECYI